MSGTFMYFAYGSNLSTKRIHMNNPSAVRKNAAKLNNYRLDFGYWSNRWKGSVATIVPDTGSTVWGCVWEIDMIDLPHLDRQESVPTIYKPIEVDVEFADGTTVKCRCYELCNQPKKILPGTHIPKDRMPSAAYLNTILEGAVESGLPDVYIADLRNIPHSEVDDIKVDQVMLPD